VTDIYEQQAYYLLLEWNNTPIPEKTVDFSTKKHTKVMNGK
jgi:hypothetical protein